MNKLLGLSLLVLANLSCSITANTNLTPADLAGMILRDEDFVLVDVRTPGEYQTGRIPGSLNVPHTEILTQIPTTDKEKLIVVYCRSGNRSSQAKYALEQAGYTNVVDFGGISRWDRELEQ